MWKILEINNVSSKYVKPCVSCCNLEECVMSCKLGILTRLVNYVSKMLNGITNTNFITDRTVSLEIRNGAIS